MPPRLCRRCDLLPPFADRLGIWLGAFLAPFALLQAGWLPAAGPDAFDDTVRPLLVRYCNDCHTGDTPEAGVRLDDRHADLAGFLLRNDSCCSLASIAFRHSNGRR